MDKNTLSNYGWIVIAVLVLSVMIALATPFGQYVEQGVRATTEGLFNTSKNAVNSAFEDLGVQMDDQEFEEGYKAPNNNTNTTALPAKGKTLEEYTWAEVQSIISNGKTEEYGFAVGSTKTLQINGATKTATIIGLNHDGENTATFMIVSSGGIGKYYMKDVMYNLGGWEKTEMREWLNTTIYESMDNVKEYIKEVPKSTNNIGYQGNSTSTTNDKLFLLSAKEVGFECPPDCNSYSNVFNGEGNKYAWFNKGSNVIKDHFWLRSPTPHDSFFFFNYLYGDFDNDKVSTGNLFYNGANEQCAVYPAFVIG